MVPAVHHPVCPEEVDGEHQAGAARLTISEVAHPPESGQAFSSSVVVWTQSSTIRAAASP